MAKNINDHDNEWNILNIAQVFNTGKQVVRINWFKYIIYITNYYTISLFLKLNLLETFKVTYKIQKRICLFTFVNETYAIHLYLCIPIIWH